MDEKFLIQKIRSLKEIEPNQDWVNSTYTKITGAQTGKGLVLEVFPRFTWKLAAVSSFSFALIVVLLVPFFFLNNHNKELENQLQITQQKIQELKVSIAENKEIIPAAEKVAQTLNETGIAIKKAQEQNNKQAIKGLLAQAIEIQIQKQETEKVLAKKIEAPEWESSIKGIVSAEIKDLETRTLNDEQQKLFEQAKLEFST
ncbi:MAG: hypothetical protein Q8O39_02200, partial [bacterium]|nr:hypothetical protein [bacterium]